ncbi:hypothetical protein JAAARDRAFT_79263 [Jaapia argillacea MUCL 33604]|uniref:Uncharacterized protein n=1 Tax=Jaapia argillacea MUCL 33604 TaxID=933084 RepID=A0A067PQ06_9AGAM|nr:hypothetical protein JAAARDRAFT_79263 [Jaapia argillacea MUCL 33604]
MNQNLNRAGVRDAEKTRMEPYVGRVQQAGSVEPVDITLSGVMSGLFMSSQSSEPSRLQRAQNGDAAEEHEDLPDVDRIPLRTPKVEFDYSSESFSSLFPTELLGIDGKDRLSGSDDARAKRRWSTISLKPAVVVTTTLEPPRYLLPDVIQVPERQPSSRKPAPSPIRIPNTPGSCTTNPQAPSTQASSHQQEGPDHYLSPAGLDSILQAVDPRSSVSSQSSACSLLTNSFVLTSSDHPSSSHRSALAREDSATLPRDEHLRIPLAYHRERTVSEGEGIQASRLGMIPPVPPVPSISPGQLVLHGDQPSPQDGVAQRRASLPTRASTMPSTPSRSFELQFTSRVSPIAETPSPPPFASATLLTHTTEKSSLPPGSPPASAGSVVGLPYLSSEHGDAGCETTTHYRSAEIQGTAPSLHQSEASGSHPFPNTQDLSTEVPPVPLSTGIEERSPVVTSPPRRKISRPKPLLPIGPNHQPSIVVNPASASENGGSPARPSASPSLLSVLPPSSPLSAPSSAPMALSRANSRSTESLRVSGLLNTISAPASRSIFARERSGSTPHPIQVLPAPKLYSVVAGDPDNYTRYPRSATNQQTFPETPQMFSPLLSSRVNSVDSVTLGGLMTGGTDGSHQSVPHSAVRPNDKTILQLLPPTPIPPQATPACGSTSKTESDRLNAVAESPLVPSRRLPTPPRRDPESSPSPSPGTSTSPSSSLPTPAFITQLPSPSPSDRTVRPLPRPTITPSTSRSSSSSSPSSSSPIPPPPTPSRKATNDATATSDVEVTSSHSSTPQLHPIRMRPGPKSRKRQGVGNERPKTAESARSCSGSLAIVKSSASSKGKQAPKATSQKSTPEFTKMPVRFRGLTLDAAQWTFTSEELQAIVSRSIRQSSEVSSIRLFDLATLDVALPEEIRRLETREAEIKVQYTAAIKRRTEILERLCCQVDGSDARSQVQPLQDLRELCSKMDRLTEELYLVNDQIGQLKRAQVVHHASALAIALRKLNTSFLKRVAEIQSLRQQISVVEAERDVAWKQAEDVAREYDELYAGVADIAAVQAPSKPSSRRSSRVSAVRMASDRASKAGLRSSLVSNLHLSASQSYPPPSPCPSTAAKSTFGFDAVPALPKIAASAFSLGTTPAMTQAMIEAEVCLMLGISLYDLRYHIPRTRSQASFHFPLRHVDPSSTGGRRRASSTGCSPFGHDRESDADSL